MINKYVLKNDVRVILEELPYLRSISIGIWILIGSANENNGNSGISHFIEHMLFKGTKNRSAKEIAEELDSVGGQLEAFTSREFTCFSARILDTHIDRAIDVLHDIVVNSTIPEEEIKKEKGVVLEEINMYEDTPQDLIHDLFSKLIWKDHQLGASILGPKENIKKFSQPEIINYFKQNYCGNNIIITAAGNFKNQELFNKIESAFNSLQKNKIDFESSIPLLHNSITIYKRKLEQVHFCLGTPGLAFNHPKRYPLYLLNSLLGGSMSSRLFQNIREKHGLVYNIYSYQSSYRNAGIFSVYAGTQENRFVDVANKVIEELDNIRQEYITDKELQNIKEQLKGAITLNFESTESRMGHLAKSEIYFREHITLNEIFKKIDNVTKDDILKIAQELFTADKITLAAIGPLKDQMKDKVSELINSKLGQK